MSLLIAASLFGGLIALIEALLNSDQSKTSTTPSNSQQPQTEEMFRIEGKQFRFRFEPIAGGYQIRALSYPPITNNNRSRQPSIIHVYSDGLICVTTPPQSLDKAKAIAKYWATGYLAYIKTGVFPDAGGRVEV